MGAACCCFRAEYEDLANSTSALHGNWFCLGGFLQNFLHMYTLLLHRGDEHEGSSSSQGMTPMTSTSSIDNSSVDVYRSPPRPTPYDSNPKRDLHEGAELVRYIGDERLESVDNKSACEKGSKFYISKNDLHLSADKPSTTYPFPYTYSFAEECPTCLEEYTIDNPKIITKCSHHFHLGCIYEWMERSDKCPVCGEVMVFDEAF